MCQIALPQLLSVYMVVDIDCIPPDISPELLDELPRHPRPAKMGGKKVPTAMSTEMIFHPVRTPIMKSSPQGSLMDHVVNPSTLEPTALSG